MIEESVSDDLVKEVLKSYETTYLELIYRIVNESKPESDNTNSTNNQTENTQQDTPVNQGNRLPSVNSINLVKITNKINDKISKINEISEKISGIGENLDQNNNQQNNPSNDNSITPEINNSKELLEIAKDNAFEDDKILSIKSFLNTSNKKYYTPEIREVVKQFNFEDNKLEVAKICYPYTIDKANYYTLNSLFNFSDTKEALNQFINNQ